MRDPIAEITKIINEEFDFLLNMEDSPVFSERWSPPVDIKQARDNIFRRLQEMRGLGFEKKEDDQ
jgi:hypothetical protein